jgi:hypothetical protein
VDQEDKLPRFSMDLIDKLDAETPIPDLPYTLNGWTEYNEATIRRQAFASGMRAMVDMLVAWSKEDEREAEHGDLEDTGEDERRWSTGRVIDSFGKYREVAAMEMAVRLPQAKPPSDPDEEG